MTHSEEFGARLKTALASRSVKQKDLAEKIGVTPNYIYMITKGLAEPSETLVVSICRVLNIREGWLKDGEGEMDQESADLLQLADMASDMITWDSESFKARFILALSELPPEAWDRLKDFARSILEQNKKDGEE